MLNFRESGKEINIKGSKFYYGILAAFLVGGLLGTGYLIIEGLKFSSAFSFVWMIGGFIFFPIFCYLFLWFLPGMIPGRTLVTLIQGPGGSLRSKKGDIPFEAIKFIELRRNGLTLVNSMYIETFDGKTFRIPTYDLIDDTDFSILVDQYIYPNMNQDAKKVWDRHVNLSKLFDEVGYERKAVQ